MKKKKRIGQGMTEYIIIVVLIAIALIAVVKLYGSTLDEIIRGSEGKMNSEVAPSAGDGNVSGGG